MISITVTMNKTTKIHIRLEDRDYHILSAEAQRLGLAISAYMRMILKEKANGLRQETK